MSLLVASPLALAETKAEVVQKLFDRGVVATKEQLLGAYAGTCFRTDGGAPTANADEPFGMVWVAREIDSKPVNNAGPLFPKTEKVIKANVWYSSADAKRGYENWTEKKAFEEFKSNGLRSTNALTNATETTFNNIYTQTYSDGYYTYESGTWNVAYQARWTDEYLVVIGRTHDDKDKKVRLACYFFKKLQ
jgi:hypothetical protein